MKRPPTALTIAGSDSGGGAGIQADLKTFTAFRVHGLVALTAVTAQNTIEVTEILPIPAETVRKQIRAVADDLGVKAAKTGMLWSTEVIQAVAEEVQRYKFPLVVDPVITAKSGAKLLKDDSVEALKNRLLPYAVIVTPNAVEAEMLSGVEIRNAADAVKAAEEIAKTGVNAVVVKGGHLPLGETVIDTLYQRGKITQLMGKRIPSKTTHGTGCVFSAAITALLAAGKNVEEAVHVAHDFVSRAIKYGFPLGGGYGPVNPLVDLYNASERYSVIEQIQDAVNRLVMHPEIGVLIPEVQSNLAMTLEYAQDIMDVAGIPGRIVNTSHGVKPSGCPTFGASKHLARTLLVVAQHDDSIRAGFNMKYSLEILEACEKLGLSTSQYDRRAEPQDVKAVEGESTSWGAHRAIEAAGRVPNVIYHKGDWGKEAMCILLGRTPREVVDNLIQIARLVHGSR